jgi:hypothetical protein
MVLPKMVPISKNYESVQEKSIFYVFHFMIAANDFIPLSYTKVGI